MSRSPNDDRSDVKNPNNDAYWADLANRGVLGDDDDYDDPVASSGIDDLHDDGLHDGTAPVPPDGILRAIKVELAKQLREFRVEVALRSATPESEARAHTAATERLLRFIEENIYHPAEQILLRQGWQPKVEKGVTQSGDPTLSFRPKPERVIRVTNLRADQVVTLETQNERGELHPMKAFRYARRSWQLARQRRNWANGPPNGHGVVEWIADGSHPSPWQDAMSAVEALVGA